MGPDAVAGDVFDVAVQDFEECGAFFEQDAAGGVVVLFGIV